MRVNRFVRVGRAGLHVLSPFCLGMLLSGVTLASAEALEPAGNASVYARWSQGPPRNADFFPIAVWLQKPARAAAYRAAGINTYVGLWEGPTESQLAALSQAGMKLICAQNETALKHLADPTIMGWMHGDEPDNAQALPGDKGYGPPIPAGKIVQDYEALRQVDPTRPVMLNLGQGVAWDRWHGRGVRTNHPEDYPEYLRGGDVVSFDIYPACHDAPEVAGKLWYVAQGVRRLAEWGRGNKIVWNCVECTRISHPDKKATPRQVRAEVWMSLIHGSMGLIYFAHEWQPKFNEAALLGDPEMLAGVTAINRQITALAPVLNSPAVKAAVQVASQNAAVPVAHMTRRHHGALYLFTVAMRDGETTAAFEFPDMKETTRVEVLGENRVLTAKAGRFEDSFKSWDAHLYRVPDAAPANPASK
jgi:hypothetical protein